MSHIGEKADSHKADTGLIPSVLWGEDVKISPKLVEQNLSDVKKTIAPYTPKIIGVTKYYGLSSIISGYEAGLRDFGESRAKEAISKIKSLPDEIRENSEFHFIGHLQTNKADEVTEYFDYIHSVDSYKTAAAISRATVRLKKREKILLQVNNAREEQKFGYDKDVLIGEFPEILSLEGLEVKGLMNMAPLGAGKDTLENLFEDLRLFRDMLQDRFGKELPELSMGMSDDYEVAVRHGATMIRIGRKLFS